MVEVNKIALTTTNALLRLVQSIVDGFNKDECTLAWLVYLEKAYDSIWREGLMVKLYKSTWVSKAKSGDGLTTSSPVEQPDAY